MGKKNRNVIQGSATEESKRQDIFIKVLHPTWRPYKGS